MEEMEMGEVMATMLEGPAVSATWKESEVLDSERMAGTGDLSALVWRLILVGRVGDFANVTVMWYWELEVLA